MTPTLQFLFSFKPKQSLVWALLFGLLLPFLLSSPVQAQAPAWQPVTTSTTQLTAGLTFPDGTFAAAMTTDAAGNVFVAGSFTSTVVFGGTTLVAVGGGSNSFVAKWSPVSSSFVWALQTSTTATSGNDQATSIAVKGNNVYVGGVTFTANTGFGTNTVTQVFNGGSAYITKITDAGSTGSFTWVQVGNAGVGGYAEASALAVSGTNIYASGWFSSSQLLFNPTMSAQVNVYNSNGGTNTSDLFVAKLTDAGSTGNVVWAQAAGGRGFDRAPALAVNGNYVYVAGFTNYAATFGATTIGSSTVRQDLPYLARLLDAGSSGAFTWATQLASTVAHPTALAVSGTSLYLAAQYTGTFTSGSTTFANAGGSHTLVGKFTDTGTGAATTWLTRGGSATQDDGPTGLAERGGYLYVSGTFNGPMASFGATTLTTPSPNSTPNLYLTRLADAGSSATFNWAQYAVGSSVVSGRGLGFGFVGVGLGAGNVNVAGSVKPPATFGTQTVTSAYAVPLVFVTSVADATLATLPVLTASTPTSGAVGTTVTLTGSNLAGITALALNGQPITGYTVNTAGTSITFVIPAGATAGVFTVTTATGTITLQGGFCVPYTPIAPNVSRCGPGAVTLQASGAPALGGVYAFYLAPTGGTALSGSTGTGSYTTPTLTTNTIYYVGLTTGQGSTGCEGPRTAVTAMVNPVPATPTTTQSVVPGGMLLTSSASSGNQWYRNGALITGATGQTYTASSPGTYTVVTTSAAGCSSASSTGQTVVLATTSPALAAQVHLYPNPTSERVTVKLPKEATVQVRNMLGQLVQARTVTEAGGTSVVLGLAGLAKGMYMVHVQIGADMVIERLVLE